MSWSDEGWSQHLRLARLATRWLSTSYSPLRAYWIKPNLLHVLNEDTGEVRVATIDQHTESILLYGRGLNDRLLEWLFNEGTKEGA